MCLWICSRNRMHKQRSTLGNYHFCATSQVWWFKANAFHNCLPNAAWKSLQTVRETVWTSCFDGFLTPRHGGESGDSPYIQKGTKPGSTGMNSCHKHNRIHSFHKTSHNIHSCIIKTRLIGHRLSPVYQYYESFYIYLPVQIFVETFPQF